MTFDFNKLVTIGFDKWKTAPFRFYGEKEPFFIGNKIEQKWRDIILRGDTALTLVNAKADSLEYLKLFGDTELLPETYLDTVTLSGGCEQRNLPSGHQELTYLQGDATAYIQTPVVPTDNTGMKIVFEYGSAGGSGAICGVFNGVAPRQDTFFVSTNSGTVDNTWSFIAQAGSTLTSANSEAPVAGKTYTALINYKNSGTYGFEGFTQQSVGTNGVLSNKVLLFARLNIANNNITASNCKIKYVEFTEGTTVTHIYIPARYNNTLGLYDKITGAFLTNTNTSGSFTAGANVTTPQPQQPIDIISNNGAIRVSKNVFDYKYYYDHYQIYQTSSVGRCPIKLKPNTTYTISTNTEFNTISAQIFVVSGSAISWTPNTSNNGVLTNSPRTLATDSSGYLCVGIYYKGDSTIPESDFDNGSVWVQIEEGSSATSYTPYSADGIYTDGTVEQVTDSLGNTASAEMLLSVGSTYKDTQKVLTGEITRRCAIKVLDGTETVTKTTSSTAPLGYYFGVETGTSHASSVAFGFCTNFTVTANNAQSLSDNTFALGSTASQKMWFATSKFTEAADFKQWLADQYANGTPVIVVYPTSSATTSTVTGQFLSKSPVTQTAGSISNLPIAITESAHTTPTPQQPLPINCNNGVVKYGVQGSNLFDKTTITTGYYYNDNLEYKTAAQSTYISDYIPVLSGKQYTLFSVNGQTAGNIRINYFNSSKQIQSQYVYAIPNSGTWEVTIIIPNGIDYIRFSAGTAFTNSLTFYQYGIYTDGTTETVEIFGNNLIDLNAVTNGYYYDAQGNYTSLSSARLTDYIPIEVGKDVKVYFKSLATVGNLNVRINIFNSNKVWQSQEVLALEPSADGTKIITPTYNGYIRVSGNYSTNQRVDWDTASVTEILGTATAQPLYKVGTYQDVQSVIDGGVTRNVGIKVLDGSESWGFTGGYIILTGFNFPIPNGGGYCTHFKTVDSSTALGNLDDTMRFGYTGNTVTLFVKSTKFQNNIQFKQYLSTQYNAGTPVIIVYPLATPTTQTVTGQPMNIQAGTNVVQITQASMDDLELEVKYKAGVAVTIEEIENAQLDDNVEVIING